MVTIDARIAALEVKMQQALAKKQRVDALIKIAKLKTSRTDDTRKKILAGSTVLHFIANGKINGGPFLKFVDQYLVSARDRALFDLPPLPAP
jgi:predicted aspartyl protease